MANTHYALGTIEASEQLLSDLYVELRRKLARWAELTKQTAQARMGYIGQHLVSVVTGFPGGKSGARGRDLILPDGSSAEIKTCYRVDQLGNCIDCSERVAAIELHCPACGSTNINRMDDSKWLIGIQHDDEFAEIVDPKAYYLVLFDFVDLNDPREVRASIWSVNPKAPGFAYCMVDYYLNIRAQSKSKAPFNLWPFSLKFFTMAPSLVYRSIILEDGAIRTQIFPGRDNPILESLAPLDQYASSRNLTADGIRTLAAYLGGKDKLAANATRNEMLAAITEVAETRNIRADLLAEAMAHVLYQSRIASHVDRLPDRLKAVITECQDAFRRKIDSL